MQEKKCKEKFLSDLSIFQKKIKMIYLIWYEEKIKYLIGLSVGLEYFLFFSKFKKKLQKYTKIIFFWKKKLYTLKKNHVFPSFSQSFMQNSENFPPPKKKIPLCKSWAHIMGTSRKHREHVGNVENDPMNLVPLVT
jgi:hypothetical protein